MKKMNRHVAMCVLASALLSVGGQTFASDEPLYNFLPTATVIENVKANLQNHGIDSSNIQVNADAKGIVELSGQVGSKQEADTVAKVVKQSEGVYAVLAALRYQGTDASDTAPVPADLPAGMEPAMNSDSEQMDIEMSRPIDTQ